MYRIVSGITSLLQHRDTLVRTPERYRPLRCPHCGLNRLWRHGCYSRKADRTGPLNPISIARFSCCGCRRTCSRLPQCIAPRRWYGWARQQQPLHALLEGASLHSSSAACDLARRTVRRWWQWLNARHEPLRFFLCSRFPELGRTTQWKTFWLATLTHLSLEGAMAALDRDGVSVP